MTVGNRIKQRRIELGLTQSELAERMGYSGKSTVCMAEICGDNITTTKVKKFADALGVTPRYLMGYEENPTATTEPSVAYTVDFPEYDFNEDKKAAADLYEKYKKASPDIQSAVDLLFKSVQHSP